MIYGRWLIDGYPKVSMLSVYIHIHCIYLHFFYYYFIFCILKVILFDLGSAYSKMEHWRKELWELSHIGVPDYDTEAKDAIVFGFLTYWFISQVSRTKQPIIVHVLATSCQYHFLQR